MGGTQLRTYRFGECILKEYDKFSCEIRGVGFAYHEKYKPELKSLNFDWTWKDYSGSGKIHFIEGTHIVVNEKGEDFSQMDVSSKSKRKPTTGKMYSPLYNDKSLEILFNKILGDAKEQGFI